MGEIFTKTYRLMIEPITWMWIPTKEKWIIGVSEDYLKEWGKKKNKDQQDNGAKSPVAVNFWLNKRKRYVKYNNWREELRKECNRVLYFPQTHDVWYKFYMPMPKSWSEKKKNQLRFEPHLQRKDTSNLVKALEDALFPDDKIIYDFRASKFWNDFGFIEIQIGGMPVAKGYTPETIVRKSDELL